MSSPGDDDRVVVIGSGPCGAIAARELVAGGARVTMLEAGTKPPKGIIVRAAGHTLMRWRSNSMMSTDRHVAIGDPDTEWYSSLSPGGLSNYWTAAVPRFAPEDFTDGARLDERFRWPIAYEELVPFYERAEDLLDITASAAALDVLPVGNARYRSELPPDWEALADRGIPRSLTRIPLARGGRWMVARRGSEFNSYHVIIEPLRSTAAFELRCGAFATRLLVGDDGEVCRGVEYHDLATGRIERLAAAAVVVAAGAVDSTRLLLSSGVGNEHQLVGTHLHDHPREWWPAEFSRPLQLLEHPAYLARAPYGDLAPLHGASATIGLATWSDRFRAIAGRAGRTVGVQTFGTMTPNPSAAVRLSTTRTDHRGVPAVEIDLHYDAVARSSLTDERARFEAVFAEAGNPVRVRAEDWMPPPGSSVHYAGTARMHERPEFGVVDAWNRVHATPNVLVVDLSCFTTNPEKNPTLTAMAIAARAANRLAATHAG